MAAANDTPPPYWTATTEGPGSTRLTYAVRGGAMHWFVIALGLAIVGGGLWGISWLMIGSEGDLTIFGYIFLLVPIGVVAFGVYVLDIALVARTSYLLDANALHGHRHSIYVRKAWTIPRSAVLNVVQCYSPPGESDSESWTTFVSYRRPDGKQDDHAMDGMKTPEEAKWLAPLLTAWSGKPIKRGFGAEGDEADPAELPDLEQERPKAKARKRGR